MSNKDNSPAGCILALWHLGVTTPMWMVMQFGVLCSLGDAVQPWLWSLYWCYVPASIVGRIIAVVIKLMED